MQSNPLSPQNVDPAAMYRARACARFYSIGLSTWWLWIKTGKAKPGIKLGPQTTVWEGAYLLELKQKLIAEAQG